MDIFSPLPLRFCNFSILLVYLYSQCSRFSFQMGPGLSHALAESAGSRLGVSLTGRQKLDTSGGAESSAVKDSQSKGDSPAKSFGTVSDPIIYDKIKTDEAEIAGFEVSELAAEQKLRAQIEQSKMKFAEASQAPIRSFGQLSCENERKEALGCISSGSDPYKCEELLDTYQECTIATKFTPQAREELFSNRIPPVLPPSIRSLQTTSAPQTT